MGARGTPDHQRLGVGALLICAAFLLFARLGDRYLWQDEAETAVLARNVLHDGYPRAFDGVHLLPVPFASHRPGYVWVFHPWVQFYLTAGSFAVFGTTTWAARLPFALLGLASVWLAWVVTRAFFHDGRISLLTAGFLTTSVPFLLHMRQCRYYAPTVFFTLASVWAYWRWLHRGRHGAWLWLVCMLGLFHTNWMPGLALAIAMGGHWAFSGGRRHLATRSFITWMGVFAGFGLLWLAYTRGWEHGLPGLTFAQIRHNLEFYLKMVNSHVIPVWLLSAAAVVQWRRGRLRSLRPNDPLAVRLVAWTCGATLLVLLLGRQHFFRYLIGVLPLLYLIAAWVLVRWWAHRPVILATVVGLILTTDLLHRPDHLLIGQPRVPLADYLYEITHDAHHDSTKGIVTFLNTHARPGQTVQIPYSKAPVVFYTSLRVDMDPAAFSKQGTPDWIVFQRDWVASQSYQSPAFASVSAQYEPIHTVIPDHLWGNTPDPYLHLFRPPAHMPGVVIYRKRETPVL